MKVTFIQARNFLSFKNISLPCKQENGKPKEKVIIVGPNNAGKSNLIRALKFARDVCRYSFKEEAGAFTNKYSGERSFELEIGFYLDEERKDLKSFTEIYAHTALSDINIDYNDWKDIVQSNKTLGRKTIGEINTCMSKSLKEASQKLIMFISNLIHSSSIVVQYNGKPTGYPSMCIKFQFDGKEIYYDDMYYIYRPDLFSSGYDLKKWFIKFLSSQDIDVVSACKKGREEEIEIKPEEWLKFILEKGQLSLGSTITIDQIKSENRAEITELLRKYDYPMEPGREINPYFFIRYMFASRIVILDEIRARPTKQFEDKRFKEEMTSHSPRIYYGIGENLALFLFRLKVAEKKEERDVYQKIKEWFKEFTGGLDFDISYKPEEEGKQHRLNIWIVDREGKYQMPIDYVGSGLLEALNIFAVLVGNENCVITLDEPALHLHPIKQRELMGKILSEATSTSGNQFIIITHSPYIIDVNSLKNVVRFNLEENETKVYSLAEVFSQERKAEDIKKKFLQNPQYKYIPFARGVIIAEGESEEIGIPLLLQKAGFDLEKYDIELFNAGSDTNFEIPIKIADALYVPYVVVCDSKAIVNNGSSQIKKALQHKMKPADKESVENILKEVNQTISQQTARERIRSIVANYNVFAFDEEDFVDFLKNKFEKACQRLEGKGVKIPNHVPKNKKVELTIKIIEETTEDEVKQVKEIQELITFIKKQILFK